MDSGALILLIVIGGLGAMMLYMSVAKATGSSQPQQARSSNSDRKPDDAELEEARSVARNLRQRFVDDIRRVLARDDELVFEQEWREDPVTDRQIQKIRKTLDETGIEQIQLTGLTKGKASDIIGLVENPSKEEEAILTFFKVDHSEMSQTHARDAIRVLMKDKANVAAWDNRPATKDQKDAIAFMGAKAPKGLTHPQAEQMIRGLAKENEELYSEWLSLNDLWEDISDKDTRDDYGCKKMTYQQFRETIAAVKQSGTKAEGIDVDQVFAKALELFPDLEKQT